MQLHNNLVSMLLFLGLIFDKSKTERLVTYRRVSSFLVSACLKVIVASYFLSKMETKIGGSGRKACCLELGLAGRGFLTD